MKNKECYCELVWTGKKDAVLEAERPTSKKLIVCREESKDFETTQNLYIEGDNLDVLKLLKNDYKSKVKMIYIDPPYNTGKKFLYNDKFSHSAWLNMIYPRLKLARDLLTDDGVIFISIDDNEQANLKKVCDEIFGEGNFVGNVTRIAKTTSFRGNYLAPSKDYLLCYAKEIIKLPQFSDEVTNDNQFNKIEQNGERKGEAYRDDIAFYLSTLETRPNQRYYIECPDGELVIPPGSTFPAEQKDGVKVFPNDGDGVWRWEQSQYLSKKNLLVFKETKRSPLFNQYRKQAKWNLYTKSYLKDKIEKGNIPRDIFDKFLNRNGSEELDKINIPFLFPKPSRLIMYLMKIINAHNDSLILDFFSGSATTAHAVMKLNAEDGGNRKFIMVQLPEVCDEGSEAANAGYKNICEIGKERIRRAGQKIKDESPLTTQNLDVGFRVLKAVDK